MLQKYVRVPSYLCSVGKEVQCAGKGQTVLGCVFFPYLHLSQVVALGSCTKIHIKAGNTQPIKAT